MKNLDDNEIIESIKRGNHSDFSLLIDKYKDRAFSLLKRMLRNELDAEEILQDCFFKAFNSLESFRLESKFSTWFYRIVYNSALSFLSSKRRRIESELSSLEDHPNLSDYDSQVYSESDNVTEYIKKIVDKLPPKNASLINMFYIDEMTIDEISKVTGLSLVNVKVILHRSRNILKDLVLKHNFHEELL